MAVVTLTKRLVEKAEPGEYWDDKLRGFVLLVTPGRHRSFQVRYRLHGRKGKHTFGHFGAMTVEQAREIARAKLFEVQQGRDPTAEKEAARRAWTVRQLAEHYEAEHLPKLREATRTNYKRYLERVIVPVLGKLPVTEVAPADVLRMFREAERAARRVAEDGTVVNSGTTTANRVLATASGLFAEAIAQGLRTDNPCASIKRNRENKRERYLTTEETARLLAACDRSPHTTAANLVRLLIFTGARRGETLKAPWSQFDLEVGVWLKPSHHTKQKALHSVPLMPAALELLRNMWEMNKDGPRSPWLFPGDDSKKHLVDPKRAVRAILTAAGLTEGVTPHTLRHSFATQAISTGASLHLVGKALGHTQAATTHRYAHAEHNPLRQMGAAVNAELERARERLKQKEAEEATRATAEVVSLDAFRNVK